jgi:bifunctional enzyme CysN/CysC
MVRAYISQVFYRIDVNTLHRESVETLSLNDIARVGIRTASPVFFDIYRNNHSTGSFILIDPHTSNTVAAGMIRGIARTVQEVSDLRAETESRKKSPHTVWSGWNIPRERREEQNGHKAAVLWFTGYSGSGKSTVAQELESRLFQRGCHTMLLDGDAIRHGLCGDLGFSDADRAENIRRIGETASLFFESGAIVLCTFISPFERDRQFVRSLIPEGRFFEIYTKCSLEECKKRDPKGLYEKALRGDIQQFTGISSPYEEPADPEMILYTETHTVDALCEQVLIGLRDGGILDGDASNG